MRPASQLKLGRVILGVALWCAALALPAFAGEKPRGLYDGASVMFERAHLIKPREEVNSGLATTLAPLVIQEVSGTNGLVAPTRVYFQFDIVQLNGRDHAALTYWWFYDGATKSVERQPPPRRGPDARPLKLARSETGVSIQGVRVTLNTNGSPVIFEVLGQRGSVAQIFVSQSVEAAALAEFGSALPGRRFVVERSLSEAPKVVVPRVIDDPPAVMGPILYLRDGSHEAATLICRCMDSQAKTLVGQSFYELAPGRFPTESNLQTDRLSRSLRLPAKF